MNHGEVAMSAVKRGRSRGPATMLGTVLATVLVTVLVTVAAPPAWSAGADEGAADRVAAPPPMFWFDAEATASYHYVNHAYFGADFGVTPDPLKRNFGWGEEFTRVRLHHGLWPGASLSVGGVVMGTTGTDYYGVKDEDDGLLDELAVNVTDLGSTGLRLVAGRQDLQVGDGFVIGDGYAESRAALWNIPVSCYDAGRADWQRGPWSALAFGARLSPTLRIGDVSPKGVVWGAEGAWSPAESRTLAAAYFQRDDDGDTQLDARAGSLRGSWSAGPAAIAGELVIEGGQDAGVDLEGRGGHLGVTFEPEARFKPRARLEYFRFTGDDPATAANEAYYAWNYRWNDWSTYYVADLVGSTLVTNSDARIGLLELGCEPRENTGVRLLLHRVDLDTGSSYGGLPDGAGHGFADEFDLVIDQGFGDHWSAWVMGAYARPRAVAKSLLGTAKSGQVFASVTYTFASWSDEDE